MAVATGAKGQSAPSAPRAPFWRNQAVRAVLYQIIAIALVVAAAAWLVDNTLANLAERKIATGFGFLDREAGFPIGESLVEFTPADTYGRAIYVGLLNTIRVAVVGIVLATLLGVVIGIARLSRNWLIAKLSAVYVEVVRNTPVLLQLFLWYSLFTEALPGPREAWAPFGPDGGLFVSNRGVRAPLPLEHGVHLWMGALVALGAVGAWVWSRRVAAHQAKTGQRLPSLLPSFALLLGPALIAWLVAGAPLAMEKPVLRGFNHVGGLTITPEFVALTLGLVVYTSAFIAEIVRAGILAVPWGQTEAARALGLPAGQTMRLVILPQALRVIVPPTTSQYLNLTKNSSLAVLIGYPDLVSTAQTTINQTGQAIEGIAIIMAIYLSISLSISAFMNWWNARIKLVER